MKKPSHTGLFFAFIFFIVLYLIWLMATPLIQPILFGAIFAGVFFPFKNYLKLKLKINNNLSSLLTCLAIILLVVLPVAFITYSMSKEVVYLFGNIKSALEHQNVNNFLFEEGFVARQIRSFSQLTDIEVSLATIKQQILNLAQNASGFVFSRVNSIIGNIFHFLFDVIIMVLVSYCLFVDGERLKKYIFNLSPLPEVEEQRILHTFNQMNYVSLVCNAIGGVIQGGLAGMAFWILGISSTTLWTVLMILLAFIPLVGISIVTIPTSIYLVLTNQVGSGIGLFIFTSLVSILVENWFKPKFIGNRVKINSNFVLLTMVGGIAAFGMGGLFYGPIIGIIFLTLVDLYHTNYKSL